MKTTKSTSNKSVSKSTSRSKARRTNGSSSRESKSNQLEELFEEELKDIYWAEKALTKAIPKMIKKASSANLVDALESHLDETEQQVSRIEKIFSIMGKDAKAKKCEAMAGLIKEAEEIISDTEEGPMRDAGIIAAAQKVEHYEIATYGTLCTFAKTLGWEEVKAILGTTLEEEKNADLGLTEIAEECINIEAAEA